LQDKVSGKTIGRPREAKAGVAVVAGPVGAAPALG